MTTTYRPSDAREAYDEARYHAADFSVGMGDPMYALASTGAIVYAGAVTLDHNLATDAEEAGQQAALWDDAEDDEEASRLWGAAHAFTVLLDVLRAARDDAADAYPDDDDRYDNADGLLDYGYALSEALRARGVPVGPPKVERGWSRGPRYVLPYTPDAP